MNNYDYIISKPPLNEDTLAHYGVKGMKWGKHSKLVSSGAEAYKIISTWSDKEYQDRLSRVRLVGGRSGSSSKGSAKSSGGGSKVASAKDKERTDAKKKEEISYPKQKIDPEITKKLQARLDKLNSASKLKTIEESEAARKKKRVR